MWELQFNGKSVVNCTGRILKFKFVSVLVEFKNLKDFSIDIKISALLFVGNAKSSSSWSTFNAVFSEMVLGPFLEG